jgi:hypothetical protein
MVEPQIWGCERATARSHPQIWYILTVNPKETLGSLMLRAIKSCWRIPNIRVAKGVRPSQP